MRALAVALLQYPLGLDFGAAQDQRDLDYYASVSGSGAAQSTLSCCPSPLLTLLAAGD